MKTIKLYGHLAKRFGKMHRFAVDTPAEAVSALIANFPGFRAHVLAHSAPGYKILVGPEDRSSVEELAYPADAETISFIPVVAGSGLKKFFKIILGAALIFLAPYAAGAVFGAGASIGFATGLSSLMVGVGASLVIGGISSLLFKPPKIPKAEQENKNTYYNGPINLSTQGNPVPLAYGRVMAGSQVISASIKSVKRNYLPAAITYNGYFSLREFTPPLPINIVGQDKQPDGTEDGIITGFTITSLPALGTLYLDSAKTQPVVAGQLITTGITTTTPGSMGSTISKNIFISITGSGTRYYRTLYYQPPTDNRLKALGDWYFRGSVYSETYYGFGSTEFKFKVHDDSDTESSVATATIRWDYNEPYRAPLSPEGN